MNLWLAAGLGYMLGSIPFGLVLTKLAGGPDVRTIGSGNIGATNVLRTGSTRLAALTLLLDVLKGTAAVLIAARYGSAEASLLAGLAAFLGHIFPVWLKFKGGKGVATYIGVLLGVYWPGAFIFGAIWLLVALVTRYSSLAALIASALTPPALYFLGLPGPAALFFAMSLLLWFMHRANIRRLMNGTEPKILKTRPLKTDG